VNNGLDDTPFDTSRAERRVVLLCNGPLEGDAALRAVAFARDADLLVGVDGGAAKWLTLGIVPHLVTGDFDSLTPEVLGALAAGGARIHPTPDQDFTDLDKALSHVLSEEGASGVRIFGATGGRLDHTFAVLSALIKYGRSGADIRLVDHIGETWLVDGETTISGETLPGRIVSLLALGEVTGIHTTGVRWPLEGESLQPGVRDGTSNEATETTITVRVGAGDLLVMVHHAGVTA